MIHLIILPAEEPETLFEGWQGPMPERVDERASMIHYRLMVVGGVREVFPGADIEWSRHVTQVEAGGDSAAEEQAAVERVNRIRRDIHQRLNWLSYRPPVVIDAPPRGKTLRKRLAESAESK